MLCQQAYETGLISEQAYRTSIERVQARRHATSPNPGLLVCHAAVIFGTCTKVRCVYNHTPEALMAHLEKLVDKLQFPEKYEKKRLRRNKRRLLRRRKLRLRQIFIPTRKAAIRRFDARIGTSVRPRSAVFVPMGSELYTTSPMHTLCHANHVAMPSNLVKPSEEASRHRDAFLEHITFLASLT